MATMTITEALAEIKTIQARVAKKREMILANVVRNESLVDPMANDGGSSVVIANELQAIGDLNRRIVALRNAITDANLKTNITIVGTTRSIHDWLVWRREISEDERKFQNDIVAVINRARNTTAVNVAPNARGRAGYSFSQPSQAEVSLAQVKMVVNISERDLAIKIETLEEILGTLDGQLSLLNATTMIEV